MTVALPWLSREPTVKGGLFGNGSLYFAQVNPNVAAVELRFQDGRSQRLTPVDGFVAAAIRSGTANTGLMSAVGLDRNGSVLSTQNLRP